MSSVNEQLVREYLEGLGFLVLQPRKYLPTGRIRRPEDDIDFLALNPRADDTATPAVGLWSGTDIQRAARLLVSVRGWHTERFSPALLKSSPEIFKFVSPAVKRRAERLLGGPVVCVLCVPAMSASEPLRKRALDLLHARGVSGVLPFRTLLTELAGMVDVHRHYDRSDVLQTLRILKAHHLLADAQLPLLRARRPRSSRRRKAASGAAE